MLSVCSAISTQKRINRDNLNGGRPRLAAEFEAFARAIEGGDQELCSRMLDTSIAVRRVLTAARRSAGIRFPCDQ